jgi:hypothetical protein
MTFEALKFLFEEQVEFRLADGTTVDGSIFIGDTEFLPVEILRDDDDAYRAEFDRWLDQVWLPAQEDRRSQILKLHGNSGRYSDLREAVARQQVVPHVGSGMSVPSGLPTWSDLLRRIRECTKVVPAQLESLLKEAAFEEAADLISGATNSNLLNERIEHVLRIDNFSVIEGPVRLLPAIFPNLAITTNLDNILELYYGGCGIRFTHVLAGQELSRYRELKNPGEGFLLKLHGDLRRAETRVLLTAEYEAAYRVGSVTREELTLLYRNNHILFLGCSLGPDRTVRLFSEVAQADKNMPRHYALVPLPDNDEVRIDRENYLTERGIYPIWYDGPHEDCITSLLAGLLDASRVDQAR